jgi:acetyl esterase/lipase
MGESAGGTLACLAGLTGKQTEFDQGQYLSADSSVQAVIDLYGITDLAAMQTRKADAKSGVPPWAFEGFAGGNTPGEWARASAVNYVTKDAPPFLIFHGTADDVVPTQQSLTLYNLLLAESADATLYCVNDAEHGDALFFQEACTRRTLSFLSRTLKTQE